MKKTKKLLAMITLITMTSNLAFQTEISAAVISEKNQISNETETVSNETVNKIDIESNSQETEIGSEKSASTTETKQIILGVGKSYEIKNTGTNDITLNWENGIYDIVYYYSNGNIKSYSRDKNYSDINLKAGEKARVTVKGNAPAQFNIANEYSKNITSKEISTKAIKDITLSVGKSYEISNTGTNDITLNWCDGIYDIVYYYSNGNIKSYSKDKNYSDINLKAGEKAKVTVKGNIPTQLYIPQDYSENITSKEISTKAIKDINLSVGKSYEISNTGTNDVTLEWEDGTYDIVYYYSNGNVKSYSKDKNYSDINLKAGEKAKVTVKGNKPTQLYIPQDYSKNIISKEISTTALKYVQIKSGKSCYLSNTSNFTINLLYDAGKINIVYYNEKGDIISTKEDLCYNTIAIKPKYKVKVTATSNEDAMYYFPNDYSKYITNSAENKLGISSFIASKQSPQAVKTAVTFTTKVSGTTGTVQYKYYRYLNGNYATIKDWSTSSSITIAPSTAGKYDIWVAVKDGSGKIVKKNIGFEFKNQANLGISSFTASKASPQPVKTGVTFTTKVSGAAGTVQYKYYRYLNGNYATIKDWSTSSSITIAPSTAGKYDIWVAVKDGSGKIVKKNIGFEFKNQANLGISSFTASKTSPQPVKTAVTFTTKVSGVQL